MPVKRTTEFADADRYLFDFKHCTYAKGWAQVDTRQDASYFGTWCNPTTRKILNYCEGDVSLQEADTDAELADLLRGLDKWNVDQGHGRALIDPGFDPAMRAAFVALGVEDLLH